jgi:hypothetical protein
MHSSFFYFYFFKKIKKKIYIRTTGVEENDDPRRGVRALVPSAFIRQGTSRRLPRTEFRRESFSLVVSVLSPPTHFSIPVHSPSIYFIKGTSAHITQGTVPQQKI